MSKHEKHCTVNPNRECGLCKSSLDIAPFIEQLKSRFRIIEIMDEDIPEITYHKVEWGGNPITLKEILRFTDGCPNCTFSILRQTKLNYAVFDFKYDYIKELKTWWSDINDELRRADERSSFY
jgi:hypothetical protein